ncbi:hypothetical protein CKAN_01524300 [Cinnamomum micranthum f. kanehirae]|uniref:Uncharacterized protein n=1 Tax=Cinnamomum micranthum f. kanehirae TaxID=337451 RepID=A0A443P6C9_9MAGN|nr:hypothetical protein CKAN_01524300 [Cinnamomum micranthum f. kanehirae]
MLKFLESTNSSLLLNVYPYYDYMQSNGIVMSDDLITLTLKKILNRRIIKQKYRRWKFLYNRKEKIMKMLCGFHFGLLRNVTRISTLRTRSTVVHSTIPPREQHQQTFWKVLLPQSCFCSRTRKQEKSSPVVDEGRMLMWNALLPPQAIPQY